MFEKNEFKICFVARNLNDELRSIILQQKISPDDFKSIAASSFHKVVAGKSGGDFAQNEESGIRNRL